MNPDQIKVVAGESLTIVMLAGARGGSKNAIAVQMMGRAEFRRPKLQEI
jgi:hypothetical protein